MIFVQLFKQLDELLYEVMSWIVFYPVTLWRTIVRPRAMMHYAGTELADAPEQQYADVLSPPLFLLLSVLIAHGVELALVGDSPVVASRHRLAVLVDSDTNLILLRLLCFAIFPLAMAVTMVAAKKEKLDRDTLRRPFYAQCYPTSVYALALSLSATLLQVHWHWAPLVVVGVWLGAIIWYLTVETGWFVRRLRIGTLRAFGLALAGFAAGLAGMILVGTLFV